MSKNVVTPQVDFGKTLLIVNPTSQSGKSKYAATHAHEMLVEALGAGVDVKYTEREKHAIEICANAADYDTIIALGGDGIVHEAANGLMQIPEDKRPRFTVIPFGSGNDYARSLGIKSSDVDTAVRQILGAKEKLVDVGCCNGEYFVETLSFGLDAGIAIATMELRKRSKKTETALYFEAGVDQILHHYDTYVFDAEIDGRKLSSKCLCITFQIGRTYGGGFIITPEAKMDDGIFEICYADPASVIKALYTFQMAKTAKHTNIKQVHFDRGSEITLKFDHRPPGQLDGEALVADEFHITIQQQVLRVLANE